MLKTDFGQLYAKQFATDEDLGEWKRRLGKQVFGRAICDIDDAYDEWVKQNPSMIPTIPEYVEMVDKCQKQRVKAQAEKEKAERVALLPPKPVIPENVAKANIEKIRQLLREAGQKMEIKSTPETDAARKSRLEFQVSLHDALLIKDFPGLGRTYIAPLEHQCSVGYCTDAGTLARDRGAFYCLKHDRNH